ncbi:MULTISPECIES: hypothetical protein [unclassified Commensalibacter]|uniref:hypothetical protein n=1 Tax=unclassified Commensalibacter TaxID=2630218 RepID=UPI0018DC56EB|nr:MULTISPECIES: hypothetical protein [unclassified Commensalibacter]MBI0017478.1 hypothetical protein [Commensalibacter sp. B14384M2]MBI0019225.1 hypothetical protein [Commensalibacter sp. W8133]MBI0050456.1 hypothetical protein [Commensalibacter sp. B14384M3]
MEKKILPYAIFIITANGGCMQTSELIHQLTEAYQPNEYWRRILKNRNDSHFSQIVRNLVCHRDRITNTIHHGVLYYNPQNGTICI